MFVCLPSLSPWKLNKPPQQVHLFWMEQFPVINFHYSCLQSHPPCQQFLSGANNHFWVWLGESTFQHISSMKHNFYKQTDFKVFFIVIIIYRHLSFFFNSHFCVALITCWQFVILQYIYKHSMLRAFLILLR